MSEIGCYDLHVYCDTTGCGNMLRVEGAPSTLGRARAIARKAGWKLDPKRTGSEGGLWATCPPCIRKAKAAK